jgi:signal transduction histidine kinase/CheY-like chemotaxis protein
MQAKRKPGNEMDGYIKMSKTTDKNLSGYQGEILVVDDSLSSLRLLSSILNQAGYLVREAVSGELALWTLSTRLPDLVLLDLRMPGMDGFEVCRRLKSNPETCAVPVIFLSAEDETTDKVQGLSVGAVDFVNKSSAHEEILARIETHITLARVKIALELERRNLEQRVNERTAELLKGKSLLRSVVDSGPDWIYAIDKTGHVLLVNQNMAQAVCAENIQEFREHNACEFFPFELSKGSETEDFYPTNDDCAVFAGTTIHLPCESILLADGSRQFFETYKTPLRDQNGDIYGLLCYRRDITERLRLENERRVLEKALWQARKMEAVGQLAGGIAHDFNNQLSLILGFAQFASAALTNGKLEKLEDYLSEILKASNSAQAVVAQLLAFSRVDQVATSPIELPSIVNETVAALRQSMPMEITLAIESGLPRVIISAIQVRQLLTNLVLNARDAVRAGGKIQVALRTEAPAGDSNCSSCHQPITGRHMLLTVKDDGEGIPAETVERIFDPFFTTKDVGQGSGLGLAMVHGITHSAGGHISVSSQPKQGTTISIWLPIADEAGSRSETAIASA